MAQTKRGNGKPEVADARRVRVRLISITKLKAYHRNARTHSKKQIEQLAGSITRFGFTNPVAIDPEGGIIAGHGRVLAAESLGLKQVPCIEIGWLTDAERRAYIISDNKLAENATWDDEMLCVEILDLKALGFDLPVLGFDAAELDSIIGDTNEAARPTLPAGDEAPFRQMTFTIHDNQVAIVKHALQKAKDAGAFKGKNKNSNGNALHRICETFVKHRPKKQDKADARPQA